jgi:hypothetical protein
MDDRRAVVNLDLSGADFFANARLLFATRAGRWHIEPLATRGERLALFRVRFSGEVRDGGTMADEHLAIVEHDAGGQAVAAVLFDLDAVEAAYAELDRRYDAGEASAFGHGAMTRAFRRAFAARDWDALAKQLAPDIVVHDHRPLGWETLRGPGAYVRALRSLVELAPDVRLRLDHVLAMSERGVLYAPTWHGTREGGAFEEPSLIVAEVDALGRFCRFDQYGLDQVERARARYDELGSAASPSRPVR